MTRSKKKIVLIGRLDSKGEEYAYIRDIIVRGGFEAIVVDTGTRGVPQLQPDVSREVVSRAAGLEIQDVVDRTDESKEIQVMMKGAVRTVQILYDSGRLDVTDAVYLLLYLFLKGPPPAFPGPLECGTDSLSFHP